MDYDMKEGAIHALYESLNYEGSRGDFLENHHIAGVTILDTTVTDIKFKCPAGFDVDGNGKLTVSDLSKLKIEVGSSDTVVNESPTYQEASFTLSSTVTNEESSEVTDTLSKTNGASLSFAIGNLFGGGGGKDSSKTTEHSTTSGVVYSEEVTWEKVVNLKIPPYTIMNVSLFVYKAELMIPLDITVEYTANIIWWKYVNPITNPHGRLDSKKTDIQGTINLKGYWKGSGIVDSHILIKPE